MDCAASYQNEEMVGHVLNYIFSQGTIRREDIFIVTKVKMPDFKDPEVSLRASLAKLQVSYVDCLLIHWPAGLFDRDPENRVPVHVLWRKFESFVDAGLTKSIGVSNFNL